MQTGQPQSNNPPPPIEPTGFFTGIKIVPIVMGIVVDVVATIVMSTFYYFIFVAKEFTEKSLSEEGLAEYWSSSEGVMVSLVLGTLGTVIGGFFAARRAGLLEIKHGALVGVGSIALGIILQSGGEESMPLNEWQMMIAYAAAIPAGALGGALAETLRGATINPASGGSWKNR